jgi:hypothetical protein
MYDDKCQDWRGRGSAEVGRARGGGTELGRVPPTSRHMRFGGRRRVPGGSASVQSIGGRLWAQGASASNAADARSTSASAKRGAVICKPTGRPSRVQPQGTLAAG